MPRKINNIKLFANNTEKAKVILQTVKEEIVNYKFNLVDHNYDLAIAIGGDGSFLRMVKANNFNSDIYYVGINAGTLGFLQEIKPDEISAFFDKLNNDDFKVDEIGIQETNVISNNTQQQFYSLNEIVIRDSDLNTAKLNLFVDDTLLEKFVGDGLLVSTSVGSTAYNLSYGGSIVYNTFHSLQITPIAPLNTKSYRDLLNSVIIPDNMQIKIIPDNKNLLITVDGENYVYNNVYAIETSVQKKRIKCLRLNDYNFLKIINDKFLD